MACLIAVAGKPTSLNKIIERKMADVTQTSNIDTTALPRFNAEFLTFHPVIKLWEGTIERNVLVQ